MKKNNKNLKRKILLAFAAIVLVITSVFSGCSSDSSYVSNSSGFSNTGTSKSAVETDMNYVSLGDGFTDVVVTDEASALEAVASVATAIGITDVQTELEVDSVDSVGDDNYYRFQQYYNGYPVYGRTVAMQVDSDGNPIVLTSNTTAIELETDTVSITQKKAETKLKRYFFTTDIEIPEISNDYLVIYNLDDASNCVLAYNFYVSANKEVYQVVIDANTAEVLCCNSFFDDIGAEVSDSNKTVTAVGWEENNTYSLYNDEYNISVFDFAENSENGISFSSPKGDVEADLTKYGFSVIESKKSDNFDTQAVELLNYVGIFSDFFSGLGYSGFDRVHAAINDSYDSGNNARGAGGYEDDKACAILLVGKNTGTEAVDILAHEYTHAVTHIIVYFGDTDSNKHPGAINEAYSDIFGEIIEANIENSNEPDWISGVNSSIGNRDIKCGYDESKNQIYNYSDYSSETNECHQASTIISYAAYLMYNGIDGTESKKIDTDMLARIWYRALYFMHSNETFSACADAVYKSAKTIKGITDDQLNCVIEAFGNVGIETSDSNILSAGDGDTLNVFDTNLTEYDNYHLTIKNTSNDEVVVDIDITDTNGYDFDLEVGNYYAIVTDNDPNGSDREFSERINIRNGPGAYSDDFQVIIYTDFGQTNITDFSIPDEMTLTLGEVDVIEPETTPAGAEGYSIKWTSSDETVATVNSTGEKGIVTSKSKGTTVITAEMVSNGETITKTTTVKVAPKGRDTVLVLDVSGSMWGTPLAEMKQSAINFCNELLTDDYDNRVGIVFYDDSTVTIDLTDDLDLLIDDIESISDGSTTNMYSGLYVAENMLDTQGRSDSVKNIIIMADGLPNEGETSDTGEMSQYSQFSYYDVSYANAVISEAQSIMSKYNMYSLGFFHDLVGDELDFATTLMRQLTNMTDGYYEVDTAENLQFVFGDIQETISDGSKIVINIACPVDVSVTYNGETLSSAQSTYSDSASFGTLQLLGKNQDVKVLSLESGLIYDVVLNGTDTGSMDYYINYIDSDDNIIDYRSFESIPITSSTVIDSNTDNSAGDVSLSIDQDGDGVVDLVWSAAQNSTATITTDNTQTSTEPVEVTEIEEQTVSEDNGSWKVVLVSVIVIMIIIAVVLMVVFLTSSSKKTRQSQIVQSTGNNVDNKITATVSLIGGSLDGKEFTINSEEDCIIGKDSSKAKIVITPDYPNVSRVHCVLNYDAANKIYYVTDQSMNGTYYISSNEKTSPYVNKYKLNKGIKTPLAAGTMLIIGNESLKIVLN